MKGKKGSLKKPSDSDQKTTSKNGIAYLLLLLGIILSVGYLWFTSQPQLASDLISMAPEPGRSVSSRELLLPSSTTSRSVLENHFIFSNSSNKEFAGETLAYITPWNSLGYSNAITHKAKLTFVSPVWFQIKPKSGVHASIAGEQDVKTDWIQELKIGNGPKLIPRFIIEGWDMQQLSTMFSSPIAACSDILEIVQVCTFPT
jgi:hypothetical protein